MIMMGGDKKKIAQMVIARAYGAEGSKARNEEAFEDRAKEPEGYDADLTLAAQDIMRAVTAGDASQLKGALYAFFEICDSMPHEEGEHKED